MREHKYAGDYNHPVLAELYDQTETYSDDVALIRKLIGDREELNILECFGGTGRILIPLAQDGHRITCIEIAQAMNARAGEKLARLGEDVQKRVTFKVQDVLDGDWGTGYDVVIMGANAFYELTSAEMQEQCIVYAREALVSSGWIFIDNDDYKGGWEKGPFGKVRVVFEGTGSDGTYCRFSKKDLSFDTGPGILHMECMLYVRSPSGVEKQERYMAKKHPVSASEVEDWLEKYGFRILHLFGDRAGNPYTPQSERAIFWAQKSLSEQYTMEAV